MGMAAVAGDADNINKQARKTAYQLAQSNPLNVPTGSSKNKQAADVLLPTLGPRQSPVGGGRPRPTHAA